MGGSTHSCRVVGRPRRRDLLRPRLGNMSPRGRDLWQSASRAGLRTRRPQRFGGGWSRSTCDRTCASTGSIRIRNSTGLVTVKRRVADVEKRQEYLERSLAISLATSQQLTLNQNIYPPSLAPEDGSLRPHDARPRTRPNRRRRHTTERSLLTLFWSDRRPSPERYRRNAHSSRVNLSPPLKRSLPIWCLSTSSVLGCRRKHVHAYPNLRVANSPRFVTGEGFSRRKSMSSELPGIPSSTGRKTCLTRRFGRR